MITNMTLGQISAISEVAKCLTNGNTSPVRRDVQKLERKRQVLRSLASNEAPLVVKKALLRRHHTIIPVILRIAHLVDTILNEIPIAR